MAKTGAANEPGADGRLCGLGVNVSSRAHVPTHLTGPRSRGRVLDHAGAPGARIYGHLLHAPANRASKKATTAAMAMAMNVRILVFRAARLYSSSVTEIPPPPGTS